MDHGGEDLRIEREREMPLCLFAGLRGTIFDVWLGGSSGSVGSVARALMLTPTLYCRR